MTKNRTKSVTIAFVLMVIIAATLITCLPTAVAQKAPTRAFLALRPNPIGVGQQLLVNAWVSPPPEWSETVYHDFTFIITDPNGVTKTYVFPRTEAVGSVWFSYVPDKVGTWTLEFSWPGQADREPCSTTQTFVVQQQPIPSWPSSPLPTDGWNYPISIENREWYQISGSWFGSDYNASRCDWNAYTQAPRSSHILWRVPPAEGVGGLIGGEYGTTGYYTQSSLSVSAVMAGRAYSSTGGKIYCIDVRTGDILWTVPGIFDVGAIRGTTAGQGSVAPGEVSTLGMLGTPVLYSFSGPRFIVYDGLTGAVTLNVTGMPSIVTMTFFGMAGMPGIDMYNDPYVYTIYNYTSPIFPFMPGVGVVGDHMRVVKWDTRGDSPNFSSRIVWNITWPGTNYYWMPPTINEGILMYANRPTNFTIAPSTAPYISTHTISLIAINDTTGELMYNKSLAVDAPWSESSGRDSMGSMYGIWYHFYDKPLTWAAYDLKTGNKLWDTSPPTDYPWGNFWAYSATAGYGMIYGLGYAGVYAWNATNGKQVWDFKDRQSLMETPYGTWPFGSNGAVLGGGVLYAPNSEHSPTLPYLRGWKLHALDAFNGQELWNIRGYWTMNAVAEGTLFATNYEDGYSYAFSRGPTLTEVSVSKDNIASGESVWISGRVTDQSPAQKGTGCVSKESMTAWMEYLHQPAQVQPQPLNTTGVPVHLYACHSNGTAYEIGTVTSDGQGYFKYEWTPPNKDFYYVSANFMGDDSYYSSWNTTTLAVGAASQAAQQYPQPIAPIDYTPLLIGVIMAVVIAIIVGVVNLFWKRK